MGCIQPHQVLPADAPIAPGMNAAVVDTLFDAYGKPTDQVGYTDGHHCVTEADLEEAAQSGASLLYGEVLVAGVSKLMGKEHLDAGSAQVLYDLGMGVGKLCMQSFLQFPSIRFVLGVELAHSRFSIAEAALKRLVGLRSNEFVLDQHIPGELVRVQTVSTKGERRRVIEFHRGNMWTVRGINTADIVVLHTELGKSGIPLFKRLIGDLKPGCKFVTYQDLSDEQLWHKQTVPFAPLRNAAATSLFATSWSARRGHHLYCWRKLGLSARQPRCELEETKESVGVTIHQACS